MLSTTLIVLSLVATSAIAELRNDFTTSYGFTKIMTNCVGDYFYYDLLRHIGEAERYCQQEPVEIPEVLYKKHDYVVKTVPVAPATAYGHYKPVVAAAHPVAYKTPVVAAAHPVAYNTPYTYNQVPYVAVKPEHKEPLLTADDVSAMIDVTKAKVSNLTCTLKKLGTVDEYLNINIQPKIAHILSAHHLSYELKHDLVKGLQQCEAMAKCLPLEYSDDAAPPPAIKRIVTFLECNKKARVISCMKEDIKRHSHHVDATPIKDLFPHETDDQTVERLMFVLYGANSNAFELI